MAKKLYSNEFILENAFQLCSKVGIQELSVRRLAAKMGSSVMPIYDAFSSKEGLIEALANFAIRKTIPEGEYVSFIQRHLHIVEFALDYPLFYLDLVKINRKIQLDPIHLEKLATMMRRESKLMYLPIETLEEINSLIECYTIGLIMWESSNNDNISQQRKSALKKHLSSYIDRILKSYLKN